MSASTISAAGSDSFPAQDIDLVKRTLWERYGRPVQVQEVEVELLIAPGDAIPSACPALYWRDGNANFVLARVQGPAGVPTFRTQFFYDENEVFGTGHTEYGNLGDCVVTVLQVQQAHAAERAKVKPAGAARAPQPQVSGDDDYHGPLVI